MRKRDRSQKSITFPLCRFWGTISWFQSIFVGDSVQGTFCKVCCCAFPYGLNKGPRVHYFLWHGALLNNTWNYNSHETTTFECPNSTHQGPKVATTVKWRLLHLASLRGENCSHNDHQTTRIASQQPWNDDFCGIVQRSRHATTVKCQVRNCTIAANLAWDFASLYGCCRFKCLWKFKMTPTFWSRCWFRVWLLHFLILANTPEKLGVLWWCVVVEEDMPFLVVLA